MLKIFIFPSCLLFFFLGATPVFAQKAPAKFGKISLDELNATVCPIDSSAHAYYIFDYGRTYLDITNGRGLHLVTERHFRVKVLDAEGTDMANQLIGLYIANGKNDESVRKLKAVAYNLEGGKVAETEMEKKSVFKENATENYAVVKFTVPNVRPGTVFEVSYEFDSDYIFDIDAWYFQYKVPNLHSSYHVSILSDFEYRRTLKGYFPIDFKQDEGTRNLAMPDGTRSLKETNFHFEGKNIPAFKTEPYLYAEDNYRSSVEFSLTRVNNSNGFAIKIAGNWGEVATRLYENEDFATHLSRSGHLRPLLAEIVDEADPVGRMGAALTQVQQHYDWDGDFSVVGKQKPSRAFEQKKGNSAEINLALVALLREANLRAEPVLVSTRQRGMLFAGEVGLRHVNHVIARVVIDSVSYFLDATDPQSLPNMLPARDYNEVGIVVGKEQWEMVKLLQSKALMMNAQSEVVLNEEGHLVGKTLVTYSQYGAALKRDGVSEFTDEGKFLSSWAADEVPGLTFQSHKFVGLEPSANPLTLEFEGDFGANVEQTGPLMLIRPWLLDYIDEQPFKSLTRDYPVEFDYPIVQSSTVKVTIPNGYIVETLPKPVRMRLPDGSAKFNCLVSQQGNVVTVTTQTTITRLRYLPEEYNDLRQFFQTIVDKEQERVILKKG
jgi:hypothetical protein